MACGRVGFESLEASSQPDAGVDGVDGPAGACAGRLFCDGFENGLGGWAEVAQFGTVSIASAPGAGLVGDALGVEVGIGENLGWVQQPVYKGLAAADRWARAYLFLPSSQNLDMEPIAMATPGDDTRVVMSLGGTSFNIHSHGLTTDLSANAAMSTPRDRWVCFELHVEVGAEGRVELFVDGVLAASAAPFDTRPPSSDLQLLEIGIVSKEPTTVQSVLADEVVADTVRPGCL